MAKQEATLLVKVKDKATKALGGIKSGIAGIKKVAGVGVGALKLMGAALGAVGAAAVATAQKFGEFRGIQRSFRNLAQSQNQDADAMLASMKKLSAGTISNAELMKQANNAMLLGLPVDRMDDMLKIARASAQATGQSLQQMFADLTTGLGRGSKLVLDNLGITFKLTDAYDEYAASLGKTANQLTEAEKKQAFINKALAVGVKNTEALGDTQMTLTESLSTVTAGFENMAVFVGQAAAPAVQFFAETIGQFFRQSDTAANQSVLQEFFMNTAKAVVVVKNAFITAGRMIGTVIGSVSAAAASLFSGNFTKAMNNAKFGMEEIARLRKENGMKTGEELNRIEELYQNQKAKIAAEGERTKFEQVQAIKAEQKAVLEEEKQAELDAEIAEQERELMMIGEHELTKQAMRLQYMRQDLANFKGTAKEKQLEQKKLAVEEKKFEQALTAFKEAENQKRIANQKSTFSTIATLSNSNNRTLAAIGKAAAITQIAIETPVAVGKALSAFPPPINFAAAAAVGVAMAAQAAQVAGVQLAEGGIVPSTPGGIQATIGEGGRSEAVIPLPDDFDPDSGAGVGGAITINFNGPVMGDQAQARQFAMVIDEQLYQLRQSNESQAFDEGIV